MSCYAPDQTKLKTDSLACTCRGGTVISGSDDENAPENNPEMSMPEDHPEIENYNFPCNDIFFAPDNYVHHIEKRLSHLEREMERASEL